LHAGFADRVDTSYIEVACRGKQPQKRHHQVQNDTGRQHSGGTVKLEAAQALAWLAEMGADEAILPDAVDRFAESEALKVAPAARAVAEAGPRPALNRPAAAPPLDRPAS
jgi:hypothetical protein